MCGTPGVADHAEISVSSNQRIQHLNVHILIMNILDSPLVSQNHHTFCFFEPSRLHFIRSSPISGKNGRPRALLQTSDPSSRLRTHISEKKYRILKNPQHKNKLVCRAAQESLHATDDFYGVLGVSKDVIPPDLKKAYRKLALQVRLFRS